MLLLRFSTFLNRVPFIFRLMNSYRILGTIFPCIHLSSRRNGIGRFLKVDNGKEGLVITCYYRDCRALNRAEKRRNRRPGRWRPRRIHLRGELRPRWKGNLRRPRRTPRRPLRHRLIPKGSAPAKISETSRVTLSKRIVTGEIVVLNFQPRLELETFTSFFN